MIKKCLWRMYESPNGKKIVKGEIAGLGAGEALVIGAMRRYRNNESFGYEHEKLTRDLHALRVFGDGQTYRLIFAHVGPGAYVALALLAFEKKSRKVPRSLIKTAEDRLRIWEGGSAGG